MIVKLRVLLVLGITISCTSNDSEKKNYGADKVPIQAEKIFIEDVDNLIQNDSLFENISIIPLETNDECLISDATYTIITKEFIYIQDSFNSLLQFDISGKFIRRIGKRGRGPGEYIQLAGFDIDINGDIYIVDMHKVLKYSSVGTFIDKYSFKTVKDIWPEQIAINNTVENGLYLWQGTNGLTHKSSPENLARMYQISKNNTLVNKYFPVKYKTENVFNRFSKFQNTVNINPDFGIDTIYNISNSGVYPKYYIDFGKYKLTKEIPTTLGSLADFKRDLDGKYATHVKNFSETSEWIYFAFNLKKRTYNCFHNKTLNKSFVSKPSRDNLPIKEIIWRIHCIWDDNLVSVLHATYIVDKCNRIKSESNLDSLSDDEVELYNQLIEVRDLDNPVILIANMKSYE